MQLNHFSAITRQCLVILLMLSIAPQFLFATAKEYFVFQPQAYKTFTEPTRDKYKNFEDWAAKKGIKWETYAKEFCPDKNNLLWVYYRSPDSLRVWFRVNDPDEQYMALQSLNTLLNNPSIRPYSKYVAIRPVTFVEGECLKPGRMQDFILVAKPAEKVTDGVIRKLKDPTEEQLRELQGMAADLKGQLEKVAPGKAAELRNKFGLNNIPSPGEDFTNFDLKGDEETKEPEEIKSQKNGKNDQGQAKKHNDKGEGNGIGGVLPDVGFARWFQTVAKLLATYYGIKNLAEQWLLVAYAIAPELFEQVGSFLAKLQHMTTPKTLEDFLDAAADIYNNLEKYLNYFIKAYQLLTSGDFSDLMKDLSKMPVGDILKNAGKLGVLPDKVNKSLNAMSGHFDFNISDLSHLTEQQMKQQLLQKVKQRMLTAAENFAKDKVIDQTKKLTSKLPIGIDVKGWYNCARQGNCKDQAKREAESILSQKLPAELKPALNPISNGDYKGAAKQLAIDQINKRTGIAPSMLDQMFNRVRQNDVAGAIRTIGKSQLYRFGDYKDIAERIMNGEVQDKEAAAKALGAYLRNIGQNAAADAIEVYGPEAVEKIMSGHLQNTVKSALSGLNLPPAVVNAFVHRNGEKAVEKLKEEVAIGMGFTDPAAKKALIEGRLDEAVRLQSLSGGWGEITLKEKAKHYKRVVSNRAYLTKALLYATKLDPRYAEEIALKIRKIQSKSKI